MSRPLWLHVDYLAQLVGVWYWRQRGYPAKPDALERMLYWLQR